MNSEGYVSGEKGERIDGNPDVILSYNHAPYAITIHNIKDEAQVHEILKAVRAALAGEGS